MKNLKVFLCFSLITFILFSFFNYKTKYNSKTEEINGLITKYNLNSNKITVEVMGKEKVIANINSDKVNFHLGDKVKLTGKMDNLNITHNFHLFDYEKYLQSKKIYWIFNVSSLKIIKKNTNPFFMLKEKVINYISKINNSYLYSFILGDNKKINDEIYKSYSTNGITHLFAISGMHVSLIATILLFFLEKILKFNDVSYIVTISFLFLYAFLTDFSPSIMRSFLMFALIFINKKGKFKLTTLEILSLSALIILALNPFYIYNMGFQYSFAISFFLISFNNLINHFKNYFLKILTISAISFLASIPITVNSFFQINLLSPLYNVIFVPFVSIILFPFTIITFFVPFFVPFLNILSNILETVSLFLEQYSLKITLSHLNMLFFLLYYVLIFITLKLISKRNFYGILIMLLTLFIHCNSRYLIFNPYLTILDVGQGDSLLIELPHNGPVILIDTGGSYNDYPYADKVIIPYLKSKGIKKINFLITTHGDMDHMKEAVNLVNNFKVDKVIFNHDEFNDLEITLKRVLDKKNIKYYKGLNKLNLNNYQLVFLNTKKYNNENDNSNVLYFKLNNYTFLLMGDAGINKEKDILDMYNISKVDFLKVGHHGSNTSSSDYFINKIKPKNCLISVGKNNRYGHPKESVLDILDDYCNIYRTDLNGSIEIKINKNNYKIKTYNP